MITKKKILQHALWGGVFGLVSGVITGYVSGFGPAVSWTLPANIEQYLLFLPPGLFLGLALGIADKSMRKTFYGVLGGLAGGVIFYLITQICKEYVIGSVVGLIAFFGIPFTPLVYVIFICFSFGIMNKSFHKALRALIGGVIALLIISPLTFLLLFGYVFTYTSMGGAPQIEKVVPILLLGYILLGVALVVGIYLGDKKGQRHLDENS